MRRRRRPVLTVIGIVANLVGIAALSPGFSLTLIGDTTTTMMWVDGYESPWEPWAWVALSIAGLATVVVALRSGGDGVTR